MFFQEICDKFQDETYSSSVYFLITMKEFFLIKVSFDVSMSETSLDR